MKQKRLAYLQTRDIPTLAWSPDGRWVITTCRLSEHNSWADNMYRISVNGDLIQGLTGSSNAIQSPNVGPMVERDLNVIRYVISGILLILIGKLTIPLGEVVRVFTETTRNSPAP
jgi:hypothetical protein